MGFVLTKLGVRIALKSRLNFKEDTKKFTMMKNRDFNPVFVIT